MNALTFKGRNSLNPLKVDAPHLIAWLDEKEPRPLGAWDAIGRAEHARAFTVAQTLGYDIVDDLYYGLVDTIEQGGDEHDFASLLMPILRQKGWLADKSDDFIGRRLQLVFDTNLRLARGAGRYERYQRTKAAFPYLHAVTARDDRVRRPPKSDDDHTAWDGIILPVEHPFWKRWWVPLGFRCRCSIIQMTRSQFARAGGVVTSEDDLAEREARLGEPIFQHPNAELEQVLEAIVERPNAERVPGLREISPPVMRQIGEDMWAAAFGEVLEAFIRLLFPQKKGEKIAPLSQDAGTDSARSTSL